MSNELWIIPGTCAVYSREEDAQVVCDFVWGKHLQERQRPRKIYKDCYVNKIKNGYKTRQVFMLKDGTHKVHMCAPFLPKYYGYRMSSFLTVVKDKKYVKCLDLKILSKDTADAVREAEKIRVRTLIDDVWNVEHMNPSPVFSLGSITPIDFVDL